MPNKLFNDVHAKDTTKDSEGKMGKGKPIGDQGSSGQIRPTFQTGMDSEGNTEVQFGMSAPGGRGKK